jgi:hypothetical protein
MNDRISTEVLDIIERRCMSATHGPWQSFVDGRNRYSGDNYIMIGGKHVFLSCASVCDQDFMAHARQDLPALIQEIRTLRTALGAQGILLADTSF